MEKTMIVVGTFLNEVESELAQNLLKAEGITSMVQKDNCGGMYPQLVMLRGIKILVGEADEQAALAVLESSNQDQPIAGWKCPSCGENIEQGFSACWQCGQEKD